MECISVSNDYDMADLKFIYHRGLPFSCDNCTVDEKEWFRKAWESQWEVKMLMIAKQRWSLMAGLQQDVINLIRKIW